MTLVIKIATLLIVEKLNKQIFDSREKDSTSGFLTYISAPRDRALSAKKRDILEHLMSEITTIQEHTGLDEKAKIIAIITALQTAKQITLSESSKVNQSRGSTERLLDHLFSFTQEFYNLAGAFKFQNKLITDDSYTLFVEACGFYFARRILDKCHTGCIKFKNNNPDARIHHAQPSVPRHIFEKVQFPEDPAYELKADCVFCYNVFSLPNIRSAYVPLPLSKYIETRTCFIENQ